MERRAIEEAFAKLKPLKAFDFYKTRVLTQEQQGWVEFICDHYFGALPDERARIHSMVTPEISFLFFMYAKAMAVDAVREQQEEKIFKGLIALAVENRVFDWRDSMMVLVLLHHSAVKIGADPSQLLQRAAAISTFQLRKLAKVSWSSRLALWRISTLQNLVIRRVPIQRAILPTYQNRGVTIASVNRLHFPAGLD